jgi:hypothetical protein
MMYSRLMPPVVILSRVEVASPPETDMPPVVSVFTPFVTVQPLLGRTALLLPPPLPAAPALPPVALPPVELPPVELPPVALPPVELPPVELPPVELPPVELPAVAAPPLGAPPYELPPVALPPVAAPAVGAPAVEPPPLPTGFDGSGVELPQPVIPIDNPKNSVGSHFVYMRSPWKLRRPGTFTRAGARRGGHSAFD